LNKLKAKVNILLYHLVSAVCWAVATEAAGLFALKAFEDDNKDSFADYFHQYE
jgi:hypothetical protein